MNFDAINTMNKLKLIRGFILVFVTLFSQKIYAENLYDVIEENLQTKMLAFEPIRTPQGLDYFSKHTFTNSKAKLESVIHLFIEGPFKSPDLDNLDKGIAHVAKLITKDIDTTYSTINMLYPGIGVNVVEFNDLQIALLDAKLAHEPKSYTTRAIIVTTKGLYSFSIIMHQFKSENNANKYFMNLLMSAVNSGLL